MKGYENYAQRSEAMRSGDFDLGQMYLQSQVWGTPKQCIEKLREMKTLTGAHHVIAVPKYGGMSFPEAEASLRLFAREVLPVVHEW